MLGHVASSSKAGRPHLHTHAERGPFKGEVSNNPGVTMTFDVRLFVRNSLRVAVQPTSQRAPSVAMVRRGRKVLRLAMLLSEDELYARVVELNRRACRVRGLTSKYGYNSILDLDLAEFCLSLRRRFPPPIRILDVGCGEGHALAQLSKSLAAAGADLGDFELWGMSLNHYYERMLIDEERFIESSLMGYRGDGKRFHLVFSVFTFHYLWQKLEAIEKIHNELLHDGGRARIHFPGFLVRFGESPEAISQNEVDGNRIFTDFLAERQASGHIPPMQYSIVPYYSDDDDCSLLAEFGCLSFEKRPNFSMRFGCSLRAFALFSEGFKFSRMDRSGLIYFASHYEATPIPSAAPPSKPFRIISLNSSVSQRSYRIDVAVHPKESDRIILMCPGAYEHLGGNAIDLSLMIERIRASELGAIVRYTDPFGDRRGEPTPSRRQLGLAGSATPSADEQADYPRVLLACFRRVLTSVIGNATKICSHPEPKIGVVAYSSSGGAVATLAADFPAIDVILLVAPSFDIAKETIASGLERFRGALYVLIGDQDEVVLPQQAFWFYKNAVNARHREYVEVPSCGHFFKRDHSRRVLGLAPEWAFGSKRPADFPPPLTDFFSYGE